MAIKADESDPEEVTIANHTLMRRYANSAVKNQPLIPNQTLAEAVKTREASMYTGKFARNLMHTMNTFDGSDLFRVCPVPQGCPPLAPVPLWGSEKANRVGGSDGVFFADAIDNNTNSLAYFKLVMQTVVQLNHVENGVSWYDGIAVVEYAQSSEIFENTTIVSENKAYYNYNTPRGLFNFSRVASGVPLYLSNPHFLDADPELVVEAFDHGPSCEWSRPNRSLHESVFYIHPITGIPVKSFDRYQFNMLMEPLRLGRGKHLGKQMKKVFMPLFWIESFVNLKDKERELFKMCDKGIDALRYVHIGSYIMGTVTLVIALGLNYIHLRHVQKKEFKRRQSGLFEALLVETGDESTPYYHNTWVSKKNAFTHPHFKRATFVVTFSTFVFAILVQLLLFHKQTRFSKHYELTLILVTCSLVPAIVGLNAIWEAKTSIRMGSFPAVRIDSSSHPLDVFVFPATRLGQQRNWFLLCLIWQFSLFIMIPVPVVLFTIHSSMDKMLLVFANASYAACIALCVFVPTFLLVSTFPNNAPKHHAGLSA